MDPSRPPLASSYGTRVALVLLALCPNIVLGVATQLLQPELLRSLHSGLTALSVAEGLSYAGYALGAVVAVVFVKRLAPRHLLIAYEVAFVVGSIIAAFGPNVFFFGDGRVIQGASTGLLLVGALPPLVTGFPSSRLPTTVAVVDVGLFGAVTLGPIVGGLAGPGSDWRVVLGLAGVFAALGAVAAYLSVPTGEPMDPDGPVDWSAVYLAAGATVLPFLAVGLLASFSLASPQVLVPLVVGLAILVALVVSQFHRKNALTPVRLISHTLPLTGLLAAMFAGGVAVSLLELALLFQSGAEVLEPSAAIAAFWPGLVGVALASGLFGLLFRSRQIPLLVNAGMGVLIVTAVGIARLTPAGGGLPLQLVAAGIGFGAGATVAPGLFQAALAVPSNQLGPIFALVELLRSVAAFLVAPIILYLAMAGGLHPSVLLSGIHTLGWAMAGLAAVGVVVILVIPLIGGSGLQKPDLGSWLDDGETALDSPPVADRIRS